ncbi:MAG TPA: RNA polymerase sigma factor [Planctomycetota bacterium]
MATDRLADHCRAFQQGDLAALDRLYELCHPPLWRFVSMLCRDRDEAADICQETWMRAMQKIHSLRAPARIQAWLFAIAHREFQKRGTRRSPAQHTNVDEVVAPDAGGDGLVLRAEQLAAASHAIDALSAEHRTVLWLSVVDGLSHAEIGRILGIPEGTARSRLHYALQALRRELEVHHD